MNEQTMLLAKQTAKSFYMIQIFLLFWGGIFVIAFYQQFIIGLLMMACSYLANIVHIMTWRR